MKIYVVYIFLINSHDAHLSSVTTNQKWLQQLVQLVDSTCFLCSFNSRFHTRFARPRCQRRSTRTYWAIVPAARTIFKELICTTCFEVCIVHVLMSSRYTVATGMKQSTSLLRFDIVPIITTYSSYVVSLPHYLMR